MEKSVFIDGHSMINRAFYGVPELTNSEGLHTNGVYGFLNILFKLIEEEKPDYLAVAFDTSAPTFRHMSYEDYKGTRHAMPQELREQVPVLKAVLLAMGVTVMELPGYEADDILGTMARRCEELGRCVSVVTGDRDLMQLATDKTCIRIPKTKKGTTTIENYFAADVQALYGITPLQYIDMKALMGDASDNIPGVPGIGEKGAAAIIGEYASIENAYAHVEELRPKRAREALAANYELAQLSKRLATIDVHAPIREEWLACPLGNLYTREACEWIRRLEFKAMLSRFSVEEERKEELPCRLIRESEEAGAVLEEFSREKSLGLHLLWEEGRVLSLALCRGEGELSLLQTGEGLSEKELREGLCRLLRSVPCIGVLDWKQLLTAVAEAEEAWRENAQDKRLLDARLASYLLNPLKSSYACEDIAREVLGLTIPSQEELLGKRTLRDCYEEGGASWERLAAQPARIAHLSQEKLRERLQENGLWPLYEELELPLVQVLCRMERAGIRVEKEALLAYGEKLQGGITRLQQEIYAETGEEFNINSPKQLGEVLFEKMKLPGAKKTKSGYSTAAEVLEKLAPEAPVVRKILEYRQLTKLKSTYVDGLSSCIAEDGRIHGLFHQTVTATGRLSSAEPNLQNIPVRMELGRELRRLFVPEEGCVLVDADYSQIELRILAHLSGDEQLIAAYNQAQDIHAITAARVFHVPLSEVTPLLRRQAKAVNFGIIYGISAFGLSEDLSITRKEAADYIGEYFEAFPGVKAYLDQTVAQAKEKGYCETLFGRRRPMPELASSNFMQRSFGERVAMNAPIQGSAADIIKRAMVRVDEALRREGLRTRLILQVHDELILEAPEEEREQVLSLLAREMQAAAALAVKLETEIRTGKSWYETK